MSPEVSVEQQLSIRMNQLNGMFDRFPMPSAICHTEGFMIRVVNPAFGEAVGMTRQKVRGRRLFEILTAAGDADVDALATTLRRRRNARFPVPVAWTAHGRRIDGEVTVELVDEALLGPLPLLVFLRVTDSVPVKQTPDLDAVAAQILAHVAGGATTAATARAVGLTVDGVNYHISRMCRTLKAPNRVSLVARAYVLGLLDPTVWPPTAR